MCQSVRGIEAEPHIAPGGLTLVLSHHQHVFERLNGSDGKFGSCQRTDSFKQLFFFLSFFLRLFTITLQK